MADPISIVLLTLASEAVLGALAGTGVESIFQKLKKDPAKRALKEALGNAIGRYVKGKNLSISKPLLIKKGFLNDDEVASEIAKLLKVNETPNYYNIAKKWQASVERTPEGFDFESESKILLNFLKDELRGSKIFRPLFETEDINSIAQNTSLSTSSLHEIESILLNLGSLLDTKYHKLVDYFRLNLSDNILDATHYIEEKTRGFIGRRWIFDLVQGFVSDYSSGYYFIMGDPGIGKTSLACQLVKEEGFFYHFNNRRTGVNSPKAFLKNICSQLISRYKLDYDVLPHDFAENGSFLMSVLNNVSNVLPENEKCVILVDALDEVDHTRASKGINVLFLPKKLPKNIQFIITLRNDLDLKPIVELEPLKPLVIKHDSSENLQDIEDYIRSATNKRELSEYIDQKEIDKDKFVSGLLGKSEGNFMYLYYVIPEISKGFYRQSELSEIPTGLKGYYHDHWIRMKDLAGKSWFSHKLPVLVALAVIKEPISIDLISDFSKVGKRAKIRSTLNEWAQFLHKSYFNVDGENGGNIRYRIYHESFQEFIAAKEEIKDEQVDLMKMHKQISDNLWDSFFGKT